MNCNDYKYTVNIPIHPIGLKSNHQPTGSDTSSAGQSKFTTLMLAAAKVSDPGRTSAYKIPLQPRDLGTSSVEHNKACFVKTLNPRSRASASTRALWRAACQGRGFQRRSIASANCVEYHSTVKIKAVEVVLHKGTSTAGLTRIGGRIGRLVLCRRARCRLPAVPKGRDWLNGLTRSKSTAAPLA